MKKVPQVLAIDDTNFNLKIVASTLMEKGYKPLLASNGKQGIAIAQAKQPDLILLDISMPEMDGFQVCEILKEDERTKNIPVIFLTATTDMETMMKGFGYGAVDYITKPFNKAELIARIKTHVELKISKEIIAEQKQKLDFAISGSHIGVWNWDMQSDQLELSDIFLNMTGYSHEEIGNSYSYLKKYIDPEYQSEFQKHIEDIQNCETDDFSIQFRIICKDNAIKWILSKGKVIRKDQALKPAYIIGTHIDITKIKHDEEQIRLLSMAVKQSANSIIITDPKAEIVFVNDHFMKKTGYAFNEVIGKNPSILKSGKHPHEFFQEMWDTIVTGKEWKGEICNKKKNGELFWELSSITSIKDEKGGIKYYLAIQEDITEKKKMMEELEYYSKTDVMTEVFNRRTGIDMLKKQLQYSKRSQKPLTISFVDLNNLKLVNDTYGHEKGDDYIKVVNECIKSILRESDTLARLGGDEFLVILPDCNIEDAKKALIRIANKIEEINLSRQYPFMASISYGFAQYNPDDKINHEALIAAADNEMYKHKQCIKQKICDENNK